MYDFLIIGAGFAGLTAAHRLKTEGFKGIVAAARDRVLTHHPDKASYFDSCGQWPGPNQDFYYSLAKELSVKFFVFTFSGKISLCSSG